MLLRKMTINRIVKFYDTIQYIIVPIHIIILCSLRKNKSLYALFNITRFIFFFLLYNVQNVFYTRV